MFGRFIMTHVLLYVHVSGWAARIGDTSSRTDLGSDGASKKSHQTDMFFPGVVAEAQNQRRGSPSTEVRRHKS